MANVIAENMFAKYDEDGHEYVLLKQLIDNWKDGQAVSMEDQRLVINCHDYVEDDQGMVLVC